MLKAHKTYLKTRMKCAWNWIKHYAPEDFKFHLRSLNAPRIYLESKEIKHAMQELYYNLSTQRETLK